ncbi:MAG TPA: hypothetical protein VGQ08_09570 [Nitrospiraceae bacterium]|jgi:hypothetical protein|nr:hypothetical protein [Nitrospiraceae bacterium]
MTELSKRTWELSLISGYADKYRGTELQGVPVIPGGGIGAADAETAARIGKHVA